LNPPPSTRREWQARRAPLRKLVVDLMGGHPQGRAPLNPELVSSTRKGGAIVEEVSFVSEPGIRLSALVSKPTRSESRLPAIVCLHGTGEDKETISDDLFDELVERGYLAIAIDMRYYTPRTYFHDIRFAVEAVVRGFCMYRDLTWDVVRTVDYLQSRKDVDGKRIGCTGFSLGGQLTWLSAALDERIAVSAPACGVTTLEAQFKEGADEWSSIGAFIPGELKYTDNSEIISLIAPRPLLILAASNDPIFPIKGARDAYRYARSVYELYGARERLGLFADERRSHAHSLKMRGKADDWFDRWLK